jgi:HD-GYP domain-containing protein (c-di-GMP phosphodiesterase class II)
MIKKIKIKDLTTGMWVERFPGSWIERPFWKQSFLLTDAKDLQTIRKSGIPFLWINTEKGRQETTDNSVTAKSTPEVIVDIQREPRALSAEEVMELERESVENEIERAYLLCEEAREAVSAMFGMSYFGRVIDIEDARKIVEKLFQSLERNRDAILSIAILKSEMEYTYSRSITVCGLMIALGFSLDLEKEQIEEAGMAGLLFDVGMMSVPPEIRFKKTRLSEAEMQIVKQHPIEGYNILKETGQFSDAVLDVCIHHHERLDGKGYPDQLVGDEIPPMSRMAAICATYESLVTDRPYRRAILSTDAIKEMFKCSVTQFDATMLEAFVKAVGIYPIGTIVRLKSDRLAVVVAQSKLSLLKPDVKAFYSIKSGIRIAPEIICLSSALARDEIVSHEDPAKWGLSHIEELWR